MKLWLYLLGGLFLFIGLFWLLAAAVGFLQYFLWIVVLGAAVAAIIGLLLRSRGLPKPKTPKVGLRERSKPERELKRMEKQQAREKAR